MTRTRSGDLVATVSRMLEAGSDLDSIVTTTGMRRDSILTALRRAGADDVRQAWLARRRTHGIGGYGRGCRCETCTTANTARLIEARKERTGQPAPVHGASSFTNYGCRCDVCVEGNRAAVAERAAIGRESASNHRKEWTGPEIEYVTQTTDGRRYLRSAAECALTLGRSVSAVDNMRKKGRKEPRYIRLAGTPNG